MFRKRRQVAPTFRIPPPFNPMTGKFAQLGPDPSAAAEGVVFCKLSEPLEVGDSASAKVRERDGEDSWSDGDTVTVRDEHNLAFGLTNEIVTCQLYDDIAIPICGQGLRRYGVSTEEFSEHGTVRIRSASTPTISQDVTAYGLPTGLSIAEPALGAINIQQDEGVIVGYLREWYGRWCVLQRREYKQVCEFTLTSALDTVTQDATASITQIGNGYDIPIGGSPPETVYVRNQYLSSTSAYRWTAAIGQKGFAVWLTGQIWQVIGMQGDT